MVSLAAGENIVDAWKSASQVVLDAPGHRTRNLLTEITDPLSFEDRWLQDFDPKSVDATDRLSVVAKVLFPEGPRAENQSREDYYNKWVRTLHRARKLGALHTSWGSTYFERLVAMDGAGNQIERAIGALSNWKKRSETALVFHLSTPALDHPKPIGSPCLQFVELLWAKDGTIDLVAVYRNHDFLNKALGNFIGLSRLLGFITTESNKSAGKITCHSVHAYCERVGKLKTLIGRP